MQWKLIWMCLVYKYIVTYSNAEANDGKVITLAENDEYWLPQDKIILETNKTRYYTT